MHTESGVSTVSHMEAASSSAQPISARLTLLYPRDLTHTWTLDEQDAVLGRQPRGDQVVLTLAHPTVSRVHALLPFDPSARRHRLIDQTSHNGTSVNGQRISTPTLIENGDVLRVGNVILVYERTPRFDSEEALLPEQTIPGNALSLQRVREAMRLAASDPSTVLLLGETGTGKEFVARAMHRLWKRRGEWAAINCAALHPELMESQLFGHVRGAFTGANEAAQGVFRSADRGTLFLDEVGDLPLGLQPKLLRALQEREVHPVGATRSVAVDVAIVAATHFPLAQLVTEHRFRADLYARLSLREIEIPPLRQRKVDLFFWLDHFASRTVQMDADVAETLLKHEWPFNLREVDRLVRELGQTQASLTMQHLPSRFTKRETGPNSRVALPTREEFVAAYHQLQGRVHALARHFGRDRRQIYRWLKAYGLREEPSSTT